MPSYLVASSITLSESCFTFSCFPLRNHSSLQYNPSPCLDCRRELLLPCSVCPQLADSTVHCPFFSTVFGSCRSATLLPKAAACCYERLQEDRTQRKCSLIKWKRHVFPRTGSDSILQQPCKEAAFSPSQEKRKPD